MFDVIVISSLLKLGFAFAALTLVWGSLRLLDYLIGVRFKNVLTGQKGIRNDPKATAIYYAARFIGACILVGMVIS